MNLRRWIAEKIDTWKRRRRWNKAGVKSLEPDIRQVVVGIDLASKRSSKSGIYFWMPNPNRRDSDEMETLDR